MTPERWQQVEAVLQAALDRPVGERAAFLSEACAGNDELKIEASSLISAYERAGEFIEQPAIAEDAHVLVGEPPQSNIGRDLGPYKIIERLGGGGMGEVYLAHDVRLNRPVALKILPAYFVSDKTRLRRFQTEARAASALNHPNILTIYEVGEFAAVHFIATEFIDGQTIRELIAMEGLTLGEVFDTAINLLFGLSAAHAAGIVHRDIKPENIMRRSDGIVKILDFGIAKLSEQTPTEAFAETATITKALTETGVVMGTVAYMSPEQARGLPVDERADIWSSGVVLYEMLTRRLPFTGATRMDAIVAILEREPPPLFQIGGDFKLQLTQIQRIVSKALCKEKDERYQTAMEMLADLKDLRQQFEIGDSSRDQGMIDSHTRVVEIQEILTRAAFARDQASSLTSPEAKSMGEPRHRYHFFVGAAVLLMAILVGALYQRSGLWKSISGTGIHGTLRPPVPNRKLYTQMSQTEQLAFLDEQEQRLAAMMGDRPVKLNNEALGAIKKHVDFYIARQHSASGKPDEHGLSVMYRRAAPYVPLMARSFAARKIPIVIGIYLPMIESEYKDCFESPRGAKGLFQFMPGTARSYGVDLADMCDAEKMTPAAAHYIADRMAELGDDSQSMTLVLLSYNRGPDWVRDTLRQLREAQNYERNFWTLFANRDKLNDFRDDSVSYIPRFFAAAIIGENPQNFDLQMPALSTLAGDAASQKR